MLKDRHFSRLGWEKIMFIQFQLTWSLILVLAQICVQIANLWEHWQLRETPASAGCRTCAALCRVPEQTLRGSLGEPSPQHWHQEPWSPVLRARSALLVLCRQSTADLTFRPWSKLRHELHKKNNFRRRLWMVLLVELALIHACKKRKSCCHLAEENFTDFPKSIKS